MEGSAEQQAVPWTPEQRKTALAKRVQEFAAKGWRIESQTDYNVSLAKGRRPNHILHLILTLLTFGLWAIVWIILTAKGETRRSMAINEFGRIYG